MRPFQRVFRTFLHMLHRVPPFTFTGTVSCLRTLWAVSFLYGEFLAFYLANWTCSWPKNAQGKPMHRIAVIADPQLTDKRSYNQHGLALALTEFYTDLYMLRSERALRHVVRPNAYIFLGDLFDGGRDLPEPAWQAELARFRKLFPFTDPLGDGPVPTYYIGGNHDYGLGATLVSDAWRRFRKVFGKTTYSVVVAGHRFVAVDSAALASVEMKSTSSEAVREVNELLEALRRESSPIPRILLTHVPLYRADGNCSSFQKGGSSTVLENVRGNQYQNMLNSGWSETLLNAIKPSLILSGDHHNYCEWKHEIDGWGTVTEYTVPTFSFAQGTLQPYVGYLSLHPPNIGSTDSRLWRTESFDASSVSFTVCPMVHQFRIYNFYASLLFFMIIAAVVVGIRETRDRRDYNPVTHEESGFRVPKPTRMRGRICETAKVALCVLWRVGWLMGLFYVGCCFVWYWLL